MSIRPSLLALLEEKKGETVSGQALAERLGVSRAAIWKGIKALQAAGHTITAVTNKGYCLEKKSDVISAQGIRLCREEQYRGLPMEVYTLLPSTNTMAKQLALEGAAHGTLVVAEEQEAGRGRRGRAFYSPPRTGVYMSLILRPDGTAAENLILTAAAAVAVCRVIDRYTNEKPVIKWVNDIFVNGRKVCGILTEAVTDFESGMVESIVVGIGVNITTDPLSAPEELRTVLGSLGDKGVPRNQWIAEIADELLTLYGQRESRAFMEEYRARSLLLGKQVGYEKNGIKFQGTAMDINDDGNLILQTSQGEIFTITSGEVTVRSKNDAEYSEAKNTEAGAVRTLHSAHRGQRFS